MERVGSFTLARLVFCGYLLEIKILIVFVPGTAAGCKVFSAAAVAGLSYVRVDAVS